MAFKSMLIVVDQETEMESLKSLVSKLAKREGAKFHVLGIAPEFPMPAFQSTQASKTARDMSVQVVANIKEKVETLLSGLPTDTSSSMVSGRVIEQVTQAVMIYQADLVLKAASVDTARGPLFGSIDKRLVRKCPAPVWIVRPEIGEKLDRIAVAIDRPDLYADSDNRRDLALSLIDHALDLATVLGIPKVSVVHAWDAVGADLLKSPRYGISADEAKEYISECEANTKAWLHDFIQTAGRQLDKRTATLESEPVFGRPRVVLVDKIHALKADILVMGTIARSGALGLLIGNTAEDVLDRLECSVLALKPSAANIVEGA